MLSSLDDIPLFARDNVKVANSTELLDKINKIIKDGTKKLQIVTDFDYTLTRQRTDNGKQILTSFGMLRECPSIPQRYRDEDHRLCNVYKPIEVDPKISREEKTRHMTEWYIAANKSLKGIKFPRKELRDVAQATTEGFREGVSEMVVWSEREGVPVLVFSAGLGESVVAALDAANFLLPHVKVVSNFLAMDENDVIVGLRGDIIHTLNKNETAIKNTEYYQMVKDRCNVIVMGDSIGDAQMADGMDHCEVTVKVGFLYHHAEDNLPNYLNHFDIVLIDDQSVNLVNAILQRLV